MEEITSDSFKDKKKRVKVGIKLREKVKEGESEDKDKNTFESNSALGSFYESGNSIKLFSNRSYELLNANKKLEELEEKVKMMESYFIGKIKIYQKEFKEKEEKYLKEIEEFRLAIEEGHSIKDKNESLAVDSYFKSKLLSENEKSLSGNFQSFCTDKDLYRSNFVNMEAKDLDLRTESKLEGQHIENGISSITKSQNEDIAELKNQIESLEDELEKSRLAQINLLVEKQVLLKKVKELETAMKFYKDRAA